MILGKFLLPLLAFGVLACEPINNKEEALDSSAVFDQKPVRSEGWTVEGQTANSFDGLNLSTTPSSQSDGISQQEMALNNASIFKKFPALTGVDSGTLRIKFSFPKIAQSGLRLDLSFATGIGLPAELRISEAGITAKCGYLNVNDGVAVQSADKKFEPFKEYEIRIARNSSVIHVFLDNKALIKDLLCTGLQDGSQEPRTAGHLKLTLFSQIPSEPVNWTSNDMQLHESKILIKRVTVHKELRLE